MRRTASSTICFHERSSRFGTGKDMGEAPKRRDSAARQVEGKDQVVDAVGGADLVAHVDQDPLRGVRVGHGLHLDVADSELVFGERLFYVVPDQRLRGGVVRRDRKSTRLNSSHSQISYAGFCLKKKKNDPPSLLP